MSTAGISANRLELLQIASAVAQEKNIDKSIVLEAIEEAIQKAARLRYGAELDIRYVKPNGRANLKNIKTAKAKSLMVSSSVLNMVTSLLILVVQKASFAATKHCHVKM